jgi:hypothetical protein
MNRGDVAIPSPSTSSPPGGRELEGGGENKVRVKICHEYKDTKKGKQGLS